MGKDSTSRKQPPPKKAAAFVYGPEPHEKVWVEVGDERAEIDTVIAPLIAELWKAHLYTHNSCQENQPGIVWIAFNTTYEAEEFLNIVAEYDPDFDSLYNRIMRNWDCPRITKPFWQFDAWPIDCGLIQKVENDMIDESHSGHLHIMLSMSVRFPLIDLPVVFERMKAHNERLQRTKADAAGIPTDAPHPAQGQRSQKRSPRK